MTNPINPNYSGVTIQISNPAVYAGGSGNAACLQTGGIQPQQVPVYNARGYSIQEPTAQIPNTLAMANPAGGACAYPPQYYLNNYNYQGVNPGVNPGIKSEGENSEQVNGNTKSSQPEKAEFLSAPDAKKAITTEQHKIESLPNTQKQYEATSPEEQDLSKSKGVIEDLDARAAALETEKKNAKDSKIVPLTNEYIKSLENYLNNPNDEIRLMASKEILTRLDEDKRRYDDAALNALLNKMLQDPSKLIRIAALSAFSSELASGNDYTVTLLHNIQANPSADKEDVLQAADILLKMSQGKEVKDIPNPKVKEENNKGQ